MAYVGINTRADFTIDCMGPLSAYGDYYGDY